MKGQLKIKLAFFASLSKASPITFHLYRCNDDPKYDAGQTKTARKGIKAVSRLFVFNVKILVWCLKS